VSLEGGRRVGGDHELETGWDKDGVGVGWVSLKIHPLG